MTVKKNLVGHRMSCNYKCDIKKLTDWLSTKNLQNIPVNQFSTYHARNFMDDISTAKKYKNVTYNNLTRAYKTIFNFFIERELVLINPFGKITKLREEDAKIVAFSEKDWGVMYKNLPTHNPTLWLIANFIYYTAIRPSEIMRLKFEDIDLVRQKIICQGNKSKNHKSQIVEIPDDFQKLLEKTNWDYPTSSLNSPTSPLFLPKASLKALIRKLIWFNPIIKLDKANSIMLKYGILSI